MRAIAAGLLAAQKGRATTPVAGATIVTTDWSDLVVRYRYREKAMAPMLTQVWLTNHGGALNQVVPARGSNVDLVRGCLIGGVPVLAELPRVWVEAVTYRGGWVRLDCIDWWGKLARWRATQQHNWLGQPVAAVVDALFALVGGITRGTNMTSMVVDFGIPPGMPGDVAFRELLAKTVDVPYAGLDGSVKFRELSPDDPSAYTFGWNAAHPVTDAEHTLGLSRYNQVTVEGMPDPLGSPYTYTANDLTQQQWVGVRALLIRDPLLGSATACQVRAEGELAYQMARAERVQLEAKPCHGLETFDMITLDPAPWNGQAITTRVTGYMETFEPGTVAQRLFPGSFTAQGQHVIELPIEEASSFVPVLH